MTKTSTLLPPTVGSMCFDLTMACSFSASTTELDLPAPSYMLVNSTLWLTTASSIRSRSRSASTLSSTSLLFMYQPTDHSLPPGIYSSILDHCQSAYPEEACGAWWQDDHGKWQTQPWENQAPAASKTMQFWVSPAQVLPLLLAQDRGEIKTLGFYHSHPNASPELSPSDQDALEWDNQPTYPNVMVFVVGINPPLSPTTCLYRWCPLSDRKNHSEKSQF
ncbi:MAG: hypothetical protein EP343_32480 [Deltaproteobacteria bacterium]|nr:MAG: hypothetical protein EP343_32480 [Deltaproteobacteria bacterium]